MADSPWTITRLELLYYSRRHKRWQIWQENGDLKDEVSPRASAPGELHRSQIFSLLQTVRGSLAEISDAHGFCVPALRNNPDLTFRIGTGGLRDVLARADNGQFWRGYLQYIRKTAQDYGIKGQLLDFLQEPTLMALTQNSEIRTMTRATALDLISMLPILRHWDLQGRWHSAVSGKRLANDCPFHTSGTWKQPFYMAALPVRSVGETHETDWQLVETPLDVELKYVDLATFGRVNEKWEPQYLEPQDFFKCCHRPSSGDELLLYQCYSFLFDKLVGLVNSAGDFFIAYPINVLGRLNFLHIWVSGEDGRKLTDLWDFWFGLSDGSPSIFSPHTSFYSRTHDFLRFNLRSIAHSTFQAAWQAVMAQPSDQAPRPQPLAYSLCECANLLMPLDWIKWTEKSEAPRDSRRTLWSYQRYDCADVKDQDGKTQSWGDASRPSIRGDESTGSLGLEWRCTESVEVPTPPRFQVVGRLETEECFIEYAIQPPRAVEVPQTLLSALLPSKAILLGAVRLALEQQLALGEMFNKQVAAETRLRLEKIRDAAHQFILDPSTIERCAADFETWRHTKLLLHSEILPWGREATIGQLLDELPPEEKEALIDLSRVQSLTWRSSMYLEVGVVKHLTHVDIDGWDRTFNLADAIQDVWTRNNIGNIEDPPRCTSWKVSVAAVREACQQCILRLATGFDPFVRVKRRDMKSHKDARCEASKFAIEEFLLSNGLSGTVSDVVERAFRPCYPIWKPFLHSFYDSLVRFGCATKVEITSRAINCGPYTPARSTGWARQEPYISCNLLTIRCPLPAENADHASKLPSSQFANSLREGGLKSYGRLLLGWRENAGRAQFLDITKADESRSADGYVAAIADRCGPSNPFAIAEGQLLVALECITVRSDL